MSPLAPWIALTAAFSPVLIGILRDLGTERPQWAPVLAGALLAIGIFRAARRRAPAPPLRVLGAVLLVLGVAAQLLGLAADAASPARLGFPVAVAGLALWLGWPSPGVVALAFLAVPIPISVLALTTPVLESAWARIAVGALMALGAPVGAGGAVIRSPDDNLTLDPADGGLPLVHLLAVWGWWTGLGGGRGRLRGAVTGAARLAPFGLLAQVLAVAVAALALLAGGWEAAVRWLHFGAPFCTLAAALVWTRRRHKSPDEAADSGP